MNKEMNKEIMRYSFILIGIIIFGLVIYPGLYKFEKLDQSFPVKINRITGDAKILTAKGWQDAGDYDYASALFAEYKQQVIDAMDGQSEIIKNDVMNSVHNDLVKAKNEIINTMESNTSHPTYPDGTSVFYSANNHMSSSKSEALAIKIGLGDSKDTVKQSLGTPDHITNGGDTWYYGSAIISFNNGVVEGWNDQLGELLLK
ncbi:hypothetical protein R70723_22180 [Paenibacillus sp. FSL R7-0273]|uniref:hypothetical protein n=1 Tax=Paenibacillus sp. FSL R7-0273 TaxID=1536772 RepID=UPI0004F7D722|nr:hypothetical protein [Paenibacillus sp. FSL R7-0273]AIQ48317.1 hypothetical protein R70723_22180 [Paenibacillus sp. FSL R7-0273]OMF86971.1 hypothetical protein BK144_24985 [Paenibacillus sp. FSL R7-0273]